MLLVGWLIGGGGGIGGEMVWRVFAGWRLYVRARCSEDRHGRSYDEAPLPLTLPFVDPARVAGGVVVVVVAAVDDFDSYVPTRTSSMTRHQSSA